ncbi:MAG: hypothetical protein A2103_03635 [Gammaproteobacteria bacterium GWF2_41_13]|nr:MAG: hypothetical protein A2103_03635 [Gammaproteobacteria bacterium GWF2_41_13]
MAIITGGGTGIGQALAVWLAKRKFDVLVVGRTLDPLQNTAKFLPEKIRYLTADVSKEMDRQKINTKIDDQKIKLLIHNAAVLSPTGDILNVDAAQFEQQLAINLEAPLFLTQCLLKNMLPGGRVFCVSSGAAYSAIPGLDSYCVSKAALTMLYNVLKNSLKKHQIQIGSAFPGIVDTPMQELIRSLDVNDFPQVDFFRFFKEEGKLLSPQKVAECFGWLLLDADDETFSKKDWDIKELLDIVK